VHTILYILYFAVQDVQIQNVVLVKILYVHKKIHLIRVKLLSRITNNKNKAEGPFEDNICRIPYKGYFQIIHVYKDNNAWLFVHFS